MERRTFVVIAAAVSLVVGLVDLITPAQLAAIYGITLDPVGAAEARLLGAAYLGYAAINWLARDVREPETQRALAVGNCGGWAISGVVSAAALSGAVVGGLAWSVVIIDAIFALGWGYFAVARPAEIRATA